jgi:uncharacterized protein (DUF58 family)
MNLIKKYFDDLFVTSRFYAGLLACICLFVIVFYFPALGAIAPIAFFIFIIFCIADYIFLFFTKRFPFAKRITAGRLSNGDENKIELTVKNEFPFPVTVWVIDELPELFQERNWKKHLTLKGKQQKKIQYFLRPLQRGEYYFGNIHLFITSPLGMVCHRFTTEAVETIHIYPAFMQLHKYELL